ncbi:uncharacterized protein HMPREF1541_00765 [Cyphellophora europaea CBS 101466]|uniref:AB hydrolase-1 domain-containing protein n=1 Tax=Cyphellophora europaea (strain CBS 101466) TaxID=1220924 RepID=W2SD80_CYPE1|nr:uncharacterized protein HMPREF1541_00765 [Cyphellophora europaea CBS 101466]ETN46580.1 hypothetical protein HMPREF1541_00765 [Cyphellophora europaea CBS 101466]
MTTAQTAITQYVTASSGIRYAFRRLGPDAGVPLVMHIHYRANMDLWDPLLLNTLAACRPVIIFDSKGVGRTDGLVPESYQGWADAVIDLVAALGHKEIDLLGFSMGGRAVQLVPLTGPGLVRRLICAGTDAVYPPREQVPGTLWPREPGPPTHVKALSEAVSVDEGKRALCYSFFYNNDHGQAEFDAYWKRVSERTAEPVNLKLLDKEGGGKRQWQAARDALAPNPAYQFDKLSHIKIPVLVANGDDDLLIPSYRSWELYKTFENAQLIMYPKAGHGFLWQYAELFGHHVNRFLDGAEFDRCKSRL